MQRWRENFLLDFHQIRIHTYKLCQYIYLLRLQHTVVWRVSEGVGGARPVVRAEVGYPRVLILISSYPLQS